LTYTWESVPLVLKFTLSSVPAWTLPLPETVDWTTPFCAVTICVEVRAELAGSPIWAIARTATASAATASVYRCHGRRRVSRMVRLRGLEAHTVNVAGPAELRRGRG
jgi:hypothetical protein